MNRFPFCRLLVLVFLFLPGRNLVAESEPAANGATLVQKFQDGFDAYKNDLKRPLDELAARYREGIVRQKEEYGRMGNAAGVLAATEALQALSSEALEIPSKDA